MQLCSMSACARAFSQVYTDVDDGDEDWKGSLDIWQWNALTQHCMQHTELQPQA